MITIENLGIFGKSEKEIFFFLKSMIEKKNNSQDLKSDNGN